MALLKVFVSSQLTLFASISVSWIQGGGATGRERCREKREVPGQGQSDGAQGGGGGLAAGAQPVPPPGGVNAHEHSPAVSQRCGWVWC